MYVCFSCLAGVTKKYEDYCSDNQYPVSIKEDTAYMCLHFTKDHEGNKIQYAVSKKDQYAVFKPYGNTIFWKISNVVPTPRNTQYAIWYDEDIHDLRSVETEFPAIVFNVNLTSNKTLSYEPTISSLNDNEIDFKISFDESDDEDYTVVFDKNSFSYKIIYANDLKMDSENDNEKVNMPLFQSPEPSVSCIDDLDFFKDFENEFPAIVYNDALTSKSDFSTEPTLCPQHIDEFDLKDETSLSEYDEVEQNILYFKDLFPFNIIYPDDLNSDKDNDDNEINMIQSSGGNENTQGSNNLLDGSHDKIDKVFIMKSFAMELNVNIVAWNYLVNRMLFNLIKNLYVPFGIPFNLKRYYKDSDCIRMLRRPRYDTFTTMLERIHDKGTHMVQVLDFEGMTELMRDVLYARIRMEHLDGDGVVVFTSQAWSRVFETMGPLVREFILEFLSTLKFGEVLLDLDAPGTIQRDISTDGDFLGHPPSYTLIRDSVLRLCHRMMAHSIAGRSQAPEKVTVTDLFYLRGLDVGSVNIPYLLGRYLRRFNSGKKSWALISGVQFVARLAKHFRLLAEERLQGLTVTAPALPIIDMAKLVRLQICVEFGDTWAWVPAGPARLEGNAGGVAKETPVALGGGDEDEEMPQAVPPPPRTQGDRIA
ncbi:hypothetical protein Tco_0175196 [Tanacetum coccineum]